MAEYLLPKQTVAGSNPVSRSSLHISSGLGFARLNVLNLVFTTQPGAPLDQTNVRQREFRPLLRQAGLPETLRFHDLRQITASLALGNGMPVPLVSEMLGQSEVTTTMRVYARAIPGAQRQVADAMEAVLGRSSPALQPAAWLRP